ncbi:MAG: hypothetical protein ACRDRY_24100, partial [Pseudonocardiaceae bacterium]
MPDVLVHTYDRLDPRLGRLVWHDPRSRDYPLPRRARPTQRISWARNGKVFDQGNVGSCHTPDTEILTANGWVPFPQLTGAEKLATVNPETRELTYGLPLRVVRKQYTGDLYLVEGRSKNFAVTADHKMLVRKWDERARTLRVDYEFVSAADIGWYAGLMATVDYRGAGIAPEYVLPGVEHCTRPAQREPRVVQMSTWLRFLGLYLAEGTLLIEGSRPNGGYKIQIAAFKEREKEFARGLFVDLGIHALELRDRFTFNDKQVYTELTKLGLRGVKASDKFVPTFVFDLPSEQIEHLLFGHFMGDGCVQNDVTSHYTSSKRLADDLHRLVFLSGQWGTLTSRPPRSTVMSNGHVIRGQKAEYRISCTSKTNLSIERKKDIRVEHYEGMVYCAEVPTHHTLVTRRDGRVLISGNCTANAALGLMMTGPFSTGAQYTEADCLQFYREETRLDNSEIPGQWEPTDTGSTGLWMMKTLQNRGLITQYLHAFDLDSALGALVVGPVAMGSIWLRGMSTPGGNGILPVNRRDRVMGGHEYVVDGYDPATDLVELTNSWGTGWGIQGRAKMRAADMGWLLQQQGDVVQ